MFSHNFNTNHTFSILSIVHVSLIVLVLLPAPTWSLICLCNECPESDYCTTSDHSESRCFKSVDRFIDNNTYINSTRYGCISASDDGLAHLQCYVSSRSHQLEPTFVACCQENYCNSDLRDPDEQDDPRWAIMEPPIERVDRGTEDKVIWPIVVATIILFIIFLGTCKLFYLITKILFNKYWKKTKPTSDSQDSICSFKVDFSAQLKNEYMNHHQHSSSSTGSTRAYSESGYLTQKPDSPAGGIYPSIETTSTLPDFTSGAGTRVLTQRTMARVVQAGETVPVGSGRFGRVFKGTYHAEDFAVKAFRSIDEESFLREENILKRLNHENIIRFIASETHDIGNYVTETWMFLEFCPYGSLCDFLDNNEICGPQHAIKILFSIIKGLHYLHEDYSQGGEARYKPPVAHRDIKSRNILMRTPETCCIADFGHAVVKVNQNTLDFGGYTRVQVGTIRYMAPEILMPCTEDFDQNLFYSYAQADMYQFGLILWEVSNRTALDVLHPAGSHRLPYDGVVPQNPSLDDMIKIVCEDNYRPPLIPQWKQHPIMRKLEDLMVECWSRKAKVRPESLCAKKLLKILHDSDVPYSVFNKY